MDRARIPYVTASLADGLRRLMELREEGVLTGEEFEAAKSGMFPVSPTWLREEMRKLATLREEGALTEEEFEVAKSSVTSMPVDMMNIPAGDTHVVYVIPPRILARILARSGRDYRSPTRATRPIA
jgi:hypothetical protein